MFPKVLEGSLAIWQNMYHLRIFGRASQCKCLLIDVFLGPIELQGLRKVTGGRLAVEDDDRMDIQADVTISTA